MSTQRMTQFPFDAALQLDDGATPAAATGYGKVGGVAMVFDTMAGAPGLGSPPVLENIRYGGVLVVDMTAITGTDVVTLEGSLDAAFTTPVTLATLNFTAVGQNHVPFGNGSPSGLLRYLRLKHTITGGPASAIAFLSPYNTEGY